MSDKLDIFDTLSNIDAGNLSYLYDLPLEHQKQFTPFVAMRWATGTSSKSQILKLNAFVNPFAFSLSSHKPLLFNLMLACSDGKQKSYKWVKRASFGSGKSASVQVVCKYYSCSSSRAREYLKLLSAEEVVDFATSLGEDSTVISSIKKELK